MDLRATTIDSPNIAGTELGPAADEPALGAAAPIRPKPSIFRRLVAALLSALQWLLGMIMMVLALALVATVPIAQLLSLGYLLETSGRIVRTGRLSAGWIGIRQAARAGTLVLGVWLWLIPLRLVSWMATSARLVHPGSPADRAWTTGLWILTTLVVMHIAGACWRGGRLRHFFWPAPIRTLRKLASPAAWAEARDRVVDFIIGMRLPYFFWLGLRGLVGGLIWLAIPIGLLAAGMKKSPALLPIGGLLFAIVVLYLPFVQARFAAENRFRAQFEVRGVRAWFGRGPWAFWAALTITLALALPLYLLKIENIPRDAAWIPSVLFVLSAWPNRFCCGWACSYAARRSRKRNWFSRQLARPAMLAVAGVYVFITYFTQYIAWHGLGSLLEQHAFLLPVPFIRF